MNVTELEVGKCYHVNSIFGICLFRLDKFIDYEDKDEENPYWKHVKVKSICITKNRIEVDKTNYIPIDAEYREVDESLLDKAIKQFNMNKAVILATINQGSI